jgi:hypothetical protein
MQTDNTTTRSIVARTEEHLACIGAHPSGIIEDTGSPPSSHGHLRISRMRAGVALCAISNTPRRFMTATQHDIRERVRHHGLPCTADLGIVYRCMPEFRDSPRRDSKLAAVDEIHVDSGGRRTTHRDGEPCSPSRARIDNGVMCAAERQVSSHRVRGRIPTIF